MFTPMSDAGPAPSPAVVVTPFIHPRPAGGAGGAAAFEAQQHALGSLLASLQAATQKGANRCPCSRASSLQSSCAGLS
jgi:hypothetical protein